MLAISAPRRAVLCCSSLHRAFATAAVARDSQRFTLPDGRVLGLAEYGAPDGKPLFYFHGYPSSRIEAGSIDSLARQKDIRIIALDRPGFGLSTPQPGRHLLDWPKDVQCVAKSFEIDKFAVMGVSGGGPYALACAYALPQNMLTSVGLFASGPHWGFGAHQMTRTRRATRRLAVSWPLGLNLIFSGVLGTLRWLFAKSSVRAFVDKRLNITGTQGATKDSTSSLESESQGIETRIKADKKMDEVLNILIGEPFAQGSAPAVDEARILSDPDWGFRLEDIKYPEILLWHGLKDINSPISMMRHIAEKVPGAKMTESDDTHYTMGRHIEDALKQLTTDKSGT